MLEKLPDLYFASMVKLALIVTDADVNLKMAKPKTIEDVMAQVEHDTGVEGRRAFEGFPCKMKIAVIPGNLQRLRTVVA
jgi:hypothetical protein